MIGQAGDHAPLWAIAFSAFILGLRHGADPDHLAAIDNLTRNSLRASQRLARFVGALFAGGHSITVLSIAALAGLFGSRLAVHRVGLETAGTWVSIVTLFAITAINVQRLLSKRAGGVASIKFAALPQRLRAASAPLAAVPVGLLFGLGFDTSSQVVAYSLALTTSTGLTFGLLVGLMFALGMALTDTLDSLLVFRLCTRRQLEADRTTRVWIIAVTTLAFVVGLYELAQLLGWRSPVPDLAVSALLVASLLAVFAWTFVMIPRRNELTSADITSSDAAVQSLTTHVEPLRQCGDSPTAAHTIAEMEAT